MLPAGLLGGALGGALAGALTVLLALSPVGLAQADPTDATATSTSTAIEAHVEVPVLPFDGRWQGETPFPDVHLYDSHLRSRVTGTIPTGTRVRVETVQNNPVLNDWYVRWDGPAGVVQGWIPVPFLTVER